MNHDESDILISRVLDGIEAEEAWTRLGRLAEAEPSIWRDLAEQQRNHADLMVTMAVAAGYGERAELPAPGVPWRFRVGAWAGWALAAAITLVWVTGVALPRRETPMAGPAAETVSAGAVAPDSAAEAVQRYLDLGKESGEVVSELPNKILLETRPLADGTGYELLYVRQFLERTVVDDLYEMEGQNEQGQPSLVRWRQPEGGGAL